MNGILFTNLVLLCGKLYNVLECTWRYNTARMHYQNKKVFLSIDKIVDENIITVKNNHTKRTNIF